MRQRAERAADQWIARHNGVITRSEALRLGLTAAQVKTRVRNNVWRQAHAGVYVVGATVDTPLCSTTAAVAACGEGAFASHLSAAWLWGLLDRTPSVTHVVVPSTVARQVRGARVWRRPGSKAATRRHGVPCSDAERTLIDCAAIVGPGYLSDLVDRALAGRVAAVDHLATAADRYKGRGRLGPVRLLENLADRGMIGAPAPSVLESRMARLLSTRHLPGAAAELVAGPAGEYRLDFAYPCQHLAVEVDGYAWHSSPEQLRRDSTRRNALTRAGWTVLVYTWWDITREPTRVAAEIAAAWGAADHLRTGQLLGAKQQ